MLLELLAASALAAVAYAFLTHGDRPDEWWPWLPYKTSYVTGHNHELERLREWDPDRH